MQTFSENVISAPLGKTYLFALGQAGFLIKSASGELLAIDPFLSNCVERIEGHAGFKRLLPYIVKPEELNLDVLITTHPHVDHYDVDSVPEIMKCPKTKLFASVNCAPFVKEGGIDASRVSYVCPGDRITVGDFAIRFIRSDHGTAAPDAVGVIVTVDGKRILELGDTCLHTEWKDMYLEEGPIDVLIGPINGMYGNLSEKELPVLAELLKAGRTIPCHYGMFASHGGNLCTFYDEMREHYPNSAFTIMALGEQMIL